MKNTVLKYYPNKMGGKNHIFRNKEDVTALCGLSGFDTSWASDPEEIKKRNICRNCEPVFQGDHVFMKQSEWDSW